MFTRPFKYVSTETLCKTYAAMYAEWVCLSEGYYDSLAACVLKDMRKIVKELEYRGEKI